jgi:uncharacterized membrane protein YraQ (UPF0718 family)
MGIFDLLLTAPADFLARGLTAVLSFAFSALAGSPAFFASAGWKSSSNFFFYETMKIFLLLAVIIYIVSFIRSFFPPEKTKRFLGEGKARGFIGNILAALLGIVTPFCSCSAVPLFIGFVEAGIPLGITFSFLIASPMVNEVALIMLWGLFGWKIALLYIATGVIAAIVAGLLIGRLKMEKYVEDYVYKLKAANLNSIDPVFRERLVDALRYVGEIMQKVWLYVVIGIGIGAGMHGWAPAGMLVKYAGPGNPFAVVIGVLIGVPLYSNAAGVIPIVKELTRLGMQLGTALSFMMAVTALSLPEMILLRKVLKPQLLAVFIGIMTVTIIVIGYLFNAVLGNAML